MSASIINLSILFSFLGFSNAQMNGGPFRSDISNCPTHPTKISDTTGWTPESRSLDLTKWYPYDAFECIEGPPGRCFFEPCDCCFLPFAPKVSSGSSGSSSSGSSSGSGSDSGPNNQNQNSPASSSASFSWSTTSNDQGQSSVLVSSSSSTSVTGTSAASVVTAIPSSSAVVTNATSAVPFSTSAPSQGSTIGVENSATCGVVSIGGSYVGIGLAALLFSL
jgi:hypothetical protein